MHARVHTPRERAFILSRLACLRHFLFQFYRLHLVWHKVLASLSVDGKPDIFLKTSAPPLVDELQGECCTIVTLYESVSFSTYSSVHNMLLLRGCSKFKEENSRTGIEWFAVVLPGLYRALLIRLGQCYIVYVISLASKLLTPSIRGHIVLKMKASYSDTTKIYDPLR